MKKMKRIQSVASILALIAIACVASAQPGPSGGGSSGGGGASGGGGSSSGASGGTGAEAQIRIYRVLTAGADAIARKLDEWPNSYVMYDPRITNDLMVARGLELQDAVLEGRLKRAKDAIGAINFPPPPDPKPTPDIPKSAAPKNAAPASRHEAKSTDTTGGGGGGSSTYTPGDWYNIPNSIFGLVGSFPTSVISTFGGVTSSTSFVNGPSTPEAFVVARLLRNLKGNVYYPSLAPINMKDDGDPLTRLFNVQVQVHQAASALNAKVKTYVAASMSNYAKSLPSNGTLPDAAKTLNNDVAAILASPTVTSSQLNMLLNDVTPAVVALRAQKNPYYNAADVLVAFLQGFNVPELPQAVDAITGLAQAADGTVAGLNAVAPSGGSGGGGGSGSGGGGGGSSSGGASPQPSGAATSDPLAISALRGYDYRTRLEHGAKILRVAVEMSGATDRVDHFGINVPSRKASAMAEISYMVFDVDGRVMTSGSVLSYLPFALDKNSLNDQKVMLLSEEPEGTAVPPPVK